MAKTITVSITETSRNVWRVTYNGNILGDSRGYSRSDAIAEARAAVKRGGGGWQGSTWVEEIRVLDPTLV